MINANHAAAFLNTVLVVQLGLFLHLARRSAKTFLEGGPHLILLPMAAITVAGVLQTLSRAGLVATAFILLVFIFLGAWVLWKVVREGGNAVVGMAILVVLTGAAAYSLKTAINIPRLEFELNSLRAIANAPKDDLRYELMMATMDMAKDRPVYGWGAGNFEYYFPRYQATYPALSTLTGKVKVNNAHNDYLQYLAELGYVGFGIICLMALYLAGKILHRIRHLDPGTLMMTVGSLGVLAHAFLEFFFYQPAVVMTFFCGAVLCVRLIELSAKARLRTGFFDLTREA